MTNTQQFCAKEGEGGYSDVMVPAQAFSGESAASNEPPDPVQFPIGHTQVVVFLQATGSLGLD